MFLVKKIVAPFFFPLPLTLLIILIGLILLWFTYRQRTGKVLVTLGAFLLLIFSLNPVASSLVSLMENQYTPFNVAAKGNPGIKYVVVLGGGHRDDFRLPATDRLSPASLKRLIEGIRIHKALPKTKLVLSGGGPFSREANAKVMLKAAQLLGVNPKETILETESKDTKDEARLLKPVLGQAPFVLVTSVSHMPRSMALFKKQGLRPLPAPADFVAKNYATARLGPHDFFPSPGSLSASTRTIYEYLGRLFAKLRNQI